MRSTYHATYSERGVMRTAYHKSDNANKYLRKGRWRVYGGGVNYWIPKKVPLAFASTGALYVTPNSAYTAEFFTI
jgi:hypothetical protein